MSRKPSPTIDKPDAPLELKSVGLVDNPPNPDCRVLTETLTPPAAANLAEIMDEVGR